MSYGEPVADAIRDHQHAAPWEYAQLSALLHVWVTRLARDFSLDVPVPVVSIGPLDHRVLADYQPGRSDIGVRTTLRINERALPTASAVDVLAALAHVVAHAHEAQHVAAPRDRRTWFHSTFWRAAMARMGIIADDHGQHIRIEQSFLDYLARHGVDVHAGASLLPATSSLPIPRAPRSIPRWTCACPGGRPVRATQFHALCLDCGTVYCRTP